MPQSYKTRNWTADKQALKLRGSLSIRFDPEVSWEITPTDKYGRQQAYNDKAFQSCLTMRVLFGMVLRQMTSFL